MTLDIDEIINYIEGNGRGRDLTLEVYERYISGEAEEEKIMQLFKFSLGRKNCNLMSLSHILFDELFERRHRRYLNFCKIFIAQFWCSQHPDAVGAFQGGGDPEDIEYLEKIAIESLPSWDERNDEMQQFFRKCTWAIGEIDRRDYYGTKGLEALMRMAKLEPEIAAYWAKKQINRTLKEKSPYINEDLSEPPEVDYDWPYPETPDQSLS